MCDSGARQKNRNVNENKLRGEWILYEKLWQLQAVGTNSKKKGVPSGDFRKITWTRVDLDYKVDHAEQSSRSHKAIVHISERILAGLMRRWAPGRD